MEYRTLVRHRAASTVGQAGQRDRPGMATRPAKLCSADTYRNLSAHRWAGDPAGRRRKGHQLLTHAHYSQLRMSDSLCGPQEALCQAHKQCISTRLLSTAEGLIQARIHSPQAASQLQRTRPLLGCTSCCLWWHRTRSQCGQDLAATQAGIPNTPTHPD